MQQTITYKKQKIVIKPTKPSGYEAYIFVNGELKARRIVYAYTKKNVIGCAKETIAGMITDEYI